MIKEIVQKCGFRPTYPKIGKLAVRVFSTALIAESLDGLNISDLFPQTSTNILAEVPMIKPIASSIASGISNALLTLRVGIVTRNYLFSESRFDKNAVSHKGAIGLMQLLPTTAQQVANDLGISFDPDDLYTPSTNILLGTYYLYTLLDRFNDLNTAICAYNAGPSKVSTWLKNSEYSTDQKTLYNTPYKETNNYLNKILRGQRIYKIYF